MANILVVYATGEGQTATVAERIVETLTETDHRAEAVDVDALDPADDIAASDAVLVGASIHMGRHQRAITSFIAAHRDTLATRPSGFFQVSLSAAIDDEAHQAEALGYIDDLVEETGWQPDRVAIVGGALRYSEYGFITRSLMKHIAKRETGDTDTSRDYEYTDWDEVEQFSRDFGTFVTNQVRQRSRATRDPERVD